MSILLALMLVAASADPGPSVQMKQGDTVSTIDQVLMADGARSPNGAKTDQAADLVKAGQPAEAIRILDTVIADEESRHKDDAQLYFSARSLVEAIVYSGLAGSQNKSSTILDDSWAYGHFLKGFALVDLGRADEAKPEFDRAIGLAPMNAQFLAERAEWHKNRKDWSNAYADFESASTASEFSPDGTKKFEKGRALRGMAFVRIGRGEWKEAERLLKQALKLNRNDIKAREELEYVKSHSKG
jgi:tetratricopeptide (TPR) repeat protein